MKRKEKKYKIEIHGAINTPNFGDVLFARMFYEACKSIPNAEVDFLQIPRFGVGKYVREETGYDRKRGKLEYLKANALILMSGGYLGLDNTSIYYVLHLYFRFIFPALLFQMLRKPVYIIGVGGGPIDSKWLRRKIKRLVNHAQKVIVRDEETRDYFIAYGVKNSIELSTDTALSYDKESIQKIEDEDFQNLFCNKKVLLLHTERPSNQEIAKKIIPSINIFLEKHKEYGVVFGYDYPINESLEETVCFKELCCETKYAYKYKNTDQMIALLNASDCIITTKLHVGIMGALCGKSVISFPTHREKTQRFYKQIGYPERCIHFTKIDDDIVLQQLEQYHNKPISIQESLITKAKENLMFVNELRK